MMRVDYRIVIMLALFLTGCREEIVDLKLTKSFYSRVSQSFLMLAREDVKDGKSLWANGSGFAVIENGTNYVYTARHVVIDGCGNLPDRLYATDVEGRSSELDLNALEVPIGNHDVARFKIKEPITHGLRLSHRTPVYQETLYFFGDAFGAGVINAEVGKVVGIGPLEFEHTADIVKGMSGGPVVDADGLVVGVCQKGRKQTAHQNGVTLPDDSKHLRVRKFGANLSKIRWKTFAPASK